MTQTVAISWTVSLFGSNDFFKTVQLSDTIPSPARLDELDLPEARRLVEPLGVNITCSHRLLGGHVGSSEGRSAFVEQQLKEWVEHFRAQLSAVAVRLPQDAYAAITTSLSQEWNYIQRVVPECGPALSPLEKAISEGFLPKLFGCEISPAERQIFELPVKLAGLGMTNPCVSAPRAYEVSHKARAQLTLAIAGAEEFDVATHRESIFNARAKARSSRNEESLRKFDASIPALGERTQRSLRSAKDFSTRAWLSAMPSEKNDTVLSAREFRDGLALRYNKPLLALPGVCDGCGKSFSLDHGLICPNGGNIIRRHNEVRDVAGQLASVAIYREGQHFLERLATRLATKWDMAYSRVMSFVRQRMSIAILRASTHCIWGASREFFSLTPESGAAMALVV